MGLNESQLKFFADYIEKELGIVYSPMNYFQLEQRIEKIATYLNLKSTEEVFDKAYKEGIFGDFKQYILNISTNNETSFFRDIRVYNMIEKSILPQMMKITPRPVNYRIWCAASSFGQEPYSVAMLANEFAKANPGTPRIEIVGTDIADHALARCNEAKYTNLEISRGLSPQRVSTHFIKESEDAYQLRPDVKNLAQFRKLNLLEPYIGMGMYHLILCRYVLIYQDQERKKSIIQRLERCLIPGGYLILGASESALGVSDNLVQVSIDGAIAYQRK